MCGEFLLWGGDRIMLSEEEAGGYWGPGVFLTTTPGKPNKEWGELWRKALDLGTPQHILCGASIEDLHALI